MHLFAIVERQKKVIVVKHTYVWFTMRIKFFVLLIIYLMKTQNTENKKVGHWYRVIEQQKYLVNLLLLFLIY
jgi:hypothetical protein